METVPPVLALARAPVETVLMTAVLAVLHSAVVLQTAILEMYPEEEEEEHGHGKMKVIKLVVLVLPGKS